MRMHCRSSSHCDLATFSSSFTLHLASRTGEGGAHVFPSGLNILQISSLEGAVAADNLELSHFLQERQEEVQNFSGYFSKIILWICLNRVCLSA